MFTINIQGIQSLKTKLENKQVRYKLAADMAIDYAHETILRRVRAGQLVDGGYRNTNSDRRTGRYSKRQADYRSDFGLSSVTHNLRVKGDLFENFRRSIGKNSASGMYIRSLYFTNKLVDRPNRRYPITYKRLANIQENNTGIGFNLSPAQMERVRQVFRQQVLRQG